MRPLRRDNMDATDHSLRRLAIGKLSRVIADEEAAAYGYLRVIDESGEDYGYSANRFFPIELPQELEKVLQLTS